MLKGLSEHRSINILKNIINKNKNVKSLIGQGFYDSILPSILKEMFY